MLSFPLPYQLLILAKLWLVSLGKFSGLVLYDPLASTDWKYSLNLVYCTYFLSVLHGCLCTFHPADHKTQLSAVHNKLQS